MAFDIETFLDDIFAPSQDEVLTLLVDVPHRHIPENRQWKDRRAMAGDWLGKISLIAPKWKMRVNPLVTYPATGSDNAGLPDACEIGGRVASLSTIIKESSIIISMPEFSATAPLFEYSRRLKNLRVASMPGAARFMQETGLAADYKKIKKRCDWLVPVFNRASGAEVRFSTGHLCFFDLTGNTPYGEDGILHPDRGGTEYSCANLPAGEVYVVPNEGESSRTAGELPFQLNGESGVFRVTANRIDKIDGHGKAIDGLRRRMFRDRAWRNIAEFAIGINDRATITGNVLQDEKAGFHWAYGRSDHLGGTVGIAQFNTPENVVHHDTVYAPGNPVVCASLDMVFTDGSRQRLIENGLLIE